MNIGSITLINNLMDNFINFLKESKIFNGFNPGDVEWWTKYAQSLIFKTEEETKQWIFEKREWADKQSYQSVFGGPDGPEYNRAFANAVPLYKSGKSWKIGKRIRKKLFGWDDIHIEPNSLENLTSAGYVNMFDNPELGPVKLVPISKLYKTERHSETINGQAKVMWLAQHIKNDGYFKAIVYGSDGEIIDGHHRYEAVKSLKLKTIPAQLLVISDE